MLSIWSGPKLSCGNGEWVKTDGWTDRQRDRLTMVKQYAFQWECIKKEDLGLHFFVNSWSLHLPVS